ncbi:MAG: hypothetical protein ACREFW_07455 [Rhizomicrobium sp.]
MCDYSLESAARRDAAVGDQLKTTKIGIHGTTGLASPAESATAVCLRPGAKLIISGIPESCRQRWGVGEVTIATFAKRDEHPAHLIGFARYRDGVKFDANPGSFVLFQEFPLGLDVSVETIPGVSDEVPMTAPTEAVPA